MVPRLGIGRRNIFRPSIEVPLSGEACSDPCFQSENVIVRGLQAAVPVGTPIPRFKGVAAFLALASSVCAGLAVPVPGFVQRLAVDLGSAPVAASTTASRPRPMGIEMLPHERA
jgi:hypothetical protein